MRLENFRLFRDSGWFTIAPLTCLVGRNSSGKSSIISSILLLKQSVEQEGTGWGPTTPPLVLNGQYCDLGNYVDVIHNHRESEEFSLSFSVTFSELERTYGNRGVPIVNLAIPRQKPYYGGYFFGTSSRSGLLPKRGSVEAHLTFSAEEPFGPSIRRFEISTTNLGTAQFVRTAQTERRRAAWSVQTSILPPRSLMVETYGRTFFPMVQIRTPSFRKCSKRTKRRIQMFVTAARLFWTFLHQGLIRTEAVKPFRTPPERRYAFGGFGASRSGGTSGEQAIDLLITETLLRPHGTRTRSLHSALSFWVKHLKLADTLDVKDIAKHLNLFQVQVTGAGRGRPAGRAPSNLADVGFGVSQVLPVLVQGLLTRPGGVYLVQQPEIHLHPDAQAGLADFFIYLACHGVITIVETHSEYLLLRIRRRLAEGAPSISMGTPSDAAEAQQLRPADVSVLFTGFEGREAIVKQLHIGGSFQFENLPSGFMSQALEDRVALLKAVSQKDA
jgi:predicted ATPase